MSIDLSTESSSAESMLYDVLVVGGGIVGLSAAVAMRMRGFSVAVLDAGKLTVDTQAIDARVYALNDASQQLLKSLDVWQTLDNTRLAPYRHMHIWDAANGAEIDFDTSLIGRDRLGTIVEESILKQALLQRAKIVGVALFPQYPVNQVQFDQGMIVVSDTIRMCRGKLLIVADGAHSATRQLLGVETVSWSYHQQAIVSIVRIEKPHQNTAYQVFNADGPLAFLPLANPHQVSIVWSTSPQHARALISLSDADFSSQLTQAFAAKLGICEVQSPRYQFPLQMRHVKRYSGPGWLLMGDAAHTIHPLAGLGLNVGLADLATWLENIDSESSHRSDFFPQKILNRYQRQRKSVLWQTIALMEGLKLVFANPLLPLVTLRGMGVRLFNQLSMLKRFIIEYAAGG